MDQTNNGALEEIATALMIWCVSLSTGKGFTQCKREVHKEIVYAFSEDKAITSDKIIAIMERATHNLGMRHG